MKKHIAFVVLVFCLVGLVGCPASTNANNSLTLHNTGTLPITFFSITRDATQQKVGINVLPGPVAAGESFSVDKLVDGIYSLCCKNAHGHAMYADQSMEGGKHYDWYVSVAKSGAAVIVESDPPKYRILDAIMRFVFRTE